ncbi:DUF6750 family protein, partial [Escherichia coli]|uniref:DUF6750 family protein n=1 Tax=Escherichia coli TaxID=562 RepID=UPI0033495C1C
RPLTDFGGKTSIFSHSVYLFLREFSLQDSRGGSGCILSIVIGALLVAGPEMMSRSQKQLGISTISIG